MSVPLWISLLTSALLPLSRVASFGPSFETWWRRLWFRVSTGNSALWRPSLPLCPPSRIIPFFPTMTTRKDSYCAPYILANHWAYLVCRACLIQPRMLQGKSNPITGLDRSWGFQEFETPRIQDNRHMKVVRLSVVRTDRLYPAGNIPGTHFYLEAESTPGP